MNEGKYQPGGGNVFIPAADRDAAMSGTEYGQRAPMPAPTPEVSPQRMPDRYGIAVGDMVSGTAIDTYAVTVGVVVAVVPYLIGDAIRHRYRVRTGDVYPMAGDVVERVVHDCPIVMVPAGEPVNCVRCHGEHANAELLIGCLVAHVRAARESAAVTR